MEREEDTTAEHGRPDAYTGVSGLGLAGMGIVGAAAAVTAHLQSDIRGWLLVWLTASAVGFGIGVVAMFLKSVHAGVPFLQGPLRRFVFSLAPALGVATLLTIILFRSGQADLLPALWLLLYGSGIVAAGIYAIRVIPLIGLCFMGLGHMVFASPAEWSDWYLLAGFGGVHLFFGVVIRRKYGG